MPFLNSLSFNSSPGGITEWVFPAARAARVFGVQVGEGATPGYRRFGYLSYVRAITLTPGSYAVRFPLGSVWAPSTAYPLINQPAAISLIFYHSKRDGKPLTLFLWGDFI